jgi:hypothetical protein
LAATGVVATAGVAAWERLRVTRLREQIAHLDAEQRDGLRPAPRPDPAYAASARAMLRERAAPWAPMLRTVESASMIGVTPTRVEFNALEGTARAELSYTDAGVLYEYLQRINEGVPPGSSNGRWRLAQVRAQADGAAGNGNALSVTGATSPATRTTAVGSIQSEWQSDLKEP